MAIVFISPFDPPERWRQALAPLLPGLDWRVWPDSVGNAEDVDVALVWRPPPGSLRQFPNLKAIYNLGAGVDSIVSDETLPDVPLIHMVDSALTRGMSEWVVYCVLHFHRDFHVFRDFQKRHHWRELPARDTAVRPIGILGLGELGQDAAVKLRAMGFGAIAGWSRSEKHVEGVESFYGPDALTPFLERTEILVCLLPLTAATQGIVNRRTLAALPEGAFFINAARGGHVVEQDLLAALDSGHIAGAALDVFRAEPLPGDSPFWDHPKVLITPHVASISMPQSSAAEIADCIRRVRQGRRLKNIVDRTRGY